VTRSRLRWVREWFFDAKTFSMYFGVGWGLALGAALGVWILRTTGVCP
jgi:hypothetical protein